MTPRLLVLIVTAIVLFLILVLTRDLHDAAVDSEGIETVGAIREGFPTFVGAALPTTTTVVRAQARTAPSKRTVVRAASAAPAVVEGAWSCGGDLPPCWVLDRENPNRDLLAYNGGCHAPVGYEGPAPCGPGHSTASGKWQIVRGTWARFKGYVNAADAPWEVQDERARQLWALCPRERHWGTC